MTALADGAGPPENRMAAFLWLEKSNMPLMVGDFAPAVKPARPRFPFAAKRCIE
jgi:hypothetical protein